MYVIDRIEEKIAVCEDLNADGKIEIPIGELPQGAKEGDIIVKSENPGGIAYAVDTAETAARKQRIHEKMKKLRQRS